MNSMEFLGHGEIGQRFSNTMMWYASIPPMSDSFIVESYPWHDLGAAKCVDVGGGNGHLSIALSERFKDVSVT